MSKLLGIKQLCEFWQSIKSTFVKKTGDTMTGDLTINKGTPAVYTKGSGINAAAANNGSSSTQYGGLYVYDKNGRAINYHGAVASSSGPITAEIVAYNYNTSGQQTGVNYIQATVAKDGTRSYTVSDPAAFRSAIGAVNKAGDTMTGLLHTNYSNASGDVGLYTKATNLTATDQLLFGIGSSSNYGIYSWKLGKWLINGTTDNKVFLAGMNFTDAASARSSIGAASRSWTALGNVTGTTPLTLNLTNYSEIYVSGNYSTVYRSGMLIPKNFISATEYEWYLGGGNKGSSSPSGRRGVFKLTLTKFTPVLMTVDGVDYTSSTCNWYVYAR